MDLWDVLVFVGDLTRNRRFGISFMFFQPILKTSNYEVRILMTVCTGKDIDFHFREVQLIKLKTLLCAFEICGSGGWVERDHNRGRNVKEVP